MSSQNQGMRTFHLHRDEDASGVSGTGIIAEGVIFSNAKVVISWLTIHKSMGFYESMAEMIAIHGHGGKTRLVWHDEMRSSK